MAFLLLFSDITQYKEIYKISQIQHTNSFTLSGLVHIDIATVCTWNNQLLVGTWGIENEVGCTSHNYDYSLNFLGFNSRSDKI